MLGLGHIPLRPCQDLRPSPRSRPKKLVIVAKYLLAIQIPIVRMPIEVTCLNNLQLIAQDQSICSPRFQGCSSKKLPTLPHTHIAGRRKRHHDLYPMLNQALRPCLNRQATSLLVGLERLRPILHLPGQRAPRTRQ